MVADRICLLVSVAVLVSVSGCNGTINHGPRGLHSKSDRGRARHLTEARVRGTTLRTASFSPDGRLLAFVLENQVSTAPERPTGQLHFVVAGPDGKVIRSGNCSSRSVAWVDDPIRLVYTNRDETGSHAVALSLGSSRISKSPLTVGQAVGSIGSWHQRVAFVVEHGDAQSWLCAWTIGRGAVSSWNVPESFRPSLDVAPVFSYSGKVIAVVSRDRTTFLGFNVHSHSWVRPVASVGPKWEWAGLQGAVGANWPSGSQGVSPTFAVDDKSLSLWIIERLSPMGATQTDTGMHALFPSGLLSPLDLDRREERVRHRAMPPVSLPIWADQFESVSCDANFEHVAVIYKTNPGRDCVVFTATLQEPFFYDHYTLVGDKSLVSGAVSLTCDGRRIAIIGRIERRAPAVVFDTRTAKMMKAWPVSDLVRSRRDAQ